MVLVGGDWRSPLPAIALALTLVQLTIGIVNIVFSGRNVVGSLLILLALIVASSPIGALATRPHASSGNIVEWAQVYSCYVAIALALTGALRIGGISCIERIDGAQAAMPVTIGPLNLLWIMVALAIAMVGSITTRPSPRALFLGWIPVGTMFVVLVPSAILIALLGGVTAAQRQATRIRPLPARQWTLRTMMSFITAICICMGVGLALRPSWEQYHYAANLAVDSVGLALFSMWCGMLSKRAWGVMWLPLLVCPAIWIGTELMGIGQANGYLQSWLAGEHQNGLDYSLASPYWIRVVMYAVIAVVAAAYGRMLAAQGIGLAFGIGQVARAEGSRCPQV